MNKFIKAIRWIIVVAKKAYVKITRISKIKYTYKGARFNLNLSKDVDSRLFYYGFEEDITDQFVKTLKKGDIVFDIGANIGIYSVLAGKIVGERGLVYSFEPANNAYEILNSNIDLNLLRNIKAYKLGVSESSGQVTFNKCEDDAYNSIGNKPMKEIKEVVTIQTTSIDEFVKNNNIKRIDVIKVDTEGAEYLIFKGGMQTLKAFKPKLFFEYNPYAINGFDNDRKELIDLVLSLGYSIYEIRFGKLEQILDWTKICTNDIIALPVEK